LRISGAIAVLTIAAFFLTNSIVPAGMDYESDATGPRTVAITGHLPPELDGLVALAHADVAASLQIRVTLKLRNRADLDQLLHAQQDPRSPQYHHWLTPGEFDARYAPAGQDIDAVANWLRLQGFTVAAISPRDRYVEASGTVAQADDTFDTTVMTFGDGTLYSNVTEPRVPAQLAGVIGSIAGLDNFIHTQPAQDTRHRAGLRPEKQPDSISAPLWPLPSQGFLNLARALDHAPELISASFMPSLERPIATPEFEFSGLSPADAYSFYDETLLFDGGFDGGGSGCIAIVGDSDILDTGPTTFANDFSLPVPSITKVLVDGSSPGKNGDENEAQLDLQWSHAVAPGAAQRFYLGNGATSSRNGPIVDAISAAVNDDLCQVISVSFAFCGSSSAFFTGTLSPIYA